MRARSPEQAAAPGTDGAAVVDGSWVLYMRRRLPDYQGFLDRMRELYRDESVAVPDTLQAVCHGCPVSPRRGRTGAPSGVAADREPLAASAAHERGAAADPAPGAAQHRRDGAGTARNGEIAHDRQHHQPLRRLRETGAGGGREGAGAAGPDGQDPGRDQGPDGLGAGRGRGEPPRAGVGHRADPDQGHRHRQGLRR